MIPVELIVTADPTTELVNVGVSVNVIVAPAPDAVAVKLVLTKLISPTLPAEPTTDPSSLKVTPANAPTSPAVNPVKLEPSPTKEDAVITPVAAMIPVELIVTADPTTEEDAVITPVALILVNVGVSVNVIVAPIPDAVAVKLLLTKSISPTLPAEPTTDPSSLIVTPANAPTSPAVNPVKLEPSP